MNYKLLVIFLSSIFLAGCGFNNQTTINKSEAPSAKEILTENKDADIFLLNKTVYQTNIEWVNKLNLTKNEEIGEIESIYTFDSNDSFKNKMATKLPIGSKIFSTNERKDMLIVENNGVEKKYYALTEG
ncbi:hypothetical protein J27TS8_21550 [Robertmurraya siralis]|uniref:Lipoprotein n=1 Tax=Robertmurraya siralis TaxID=77777 RepID=A0A919WI56_9BACI|nr:hypothetical protein [Robertmurraya siralis]GIN62162.1 hypothetical protein J27TS8_21550 [Robertmurraya siralis]